MSRISPDRVTLPPVAFLRLLSSNVHTCFAIHFMRGLRGSCVLMGTHDTLPWSSDDDGPNAAICSSKAAAHACVCVCVCMSEYASYMCAQTKDKICSSKRRDPSLCVYVCRSEYASYMCAQTKGKICSSKSRGPCLSVLCVDTRIMRIVPPLIYAGMDACIAICMYY